MRIRVAACGIWLVLSGLVDATALRAPADDALHALRFLEGSWSGEIDGTIGPSTGRREYRFIIHDRFLLMQHDRDPFEQGSEDDSHEEWSIFGYDADRELIVLTEFLVEGFVNSYACEIDSGPTTLSCTGKPSEGDPGSVLRLQYGFEGPDEFTETFEIVGSDGTAELSLHSRWQRTQG